MSQSLFYWKPLGNEWKKWDDFSPLEVTILILLETTLQLFLTGKGRRHLNSHNPYFTGNHFAISDRYDELNIYSNVTILILLETTLQYVYRFKHR